MTDTKNLAPYLKWLKQKKEASHCEIHMQVLVQTQSALHINHASTEDRCFSTTSLLLPLFIHRLGHALMAFRLSRVCAPLPPDKTMELGHHILKAHIYKSVGRQRGYSSRDMQAFWMCLSSHSLSQALVTHRNVFSPNVKVSRNCVWPWCCLILTCEDFGRMFDDSFTTCAFFVFFCLFVF